jgi:hypothetical protein
VSLEPLLDESDVMCCSCVKIEGLLSVLMLIAARQIIQNVTSTRQNGDTKLTEVTRSTNEHEFKSRTG